MREQIPAILRHMQNNVTREITVEQIAAHFGYSKYHFSREFKRWTGFSAADYLSSLKIEHAKQALLRDAQSVTHSGFDAGFASLGTFSVTFKQKTGLSPREYKQQVEALFSLAKQVEDRPTAVEGPADAQAPETGRCFVTIRYPAGYRPGITFVGLFRSPIPNHRPVAGVALIKKNTHLFERLPGGVYHLLACSIEKSPNPLRYFVLDDCLRGRVERPVRFPADNGQSFVVTLREPHPDDPPILINLPKLLADALTK